MLRTFFAASVMLALVCITYARACPIHESAMTATAAQRANPSSYMTSVARGGGPPYDDNLGYRWKSTATPNGYNVTLDAPKNTMRYVGTTPMIPIKHEFDFAMTGPAKVNFFAAANPDPASTSPLPYFLYRAKFTNKSGKDWSGFTFTITDNNNTDYPGQGQNGSLLHPDRAHFHVDGLKAAQLGFTTVDTVRKVRNSNGEIETDNPGLNTDGGVYQITMKDGFTVKNNETWEPMKFVAEANRPDTADTELSSLIPFHVRVTAATSYTVTFEPILVPEPSMAGLAFLIGSLVLRRRR